MTTHQGEGEGAVKGEKIRGEFFVYLHITHILTAERQAFTLKQDRMEGRQINPYYTHDNFLPVEQQDT